MDATSRPVASAAAGGQRCSRAQCRIDRWTQKLLDFSARNRLLNIPGKSRQVVRLMCADVRTLENAIADNKAIAIRSIADVMGEKALDDLSSGRLSREKCEAALAAELASQRLCVAMSPSEVRRRLGDLLHEARTSLEESGVNTLFLTIGELQWLEPGNGAGRKPYRAPILMIPVRLMRASMADGVKMYRLDDEPTLNTTLVEFLRAQFGVTLSGLDPLPSDDAGVDVQQVLQAFRQAVKGLEGWEVFEETTVGCYSFGKFVMWKEMTTRVAELKKNPIVSHLVDGGGLFDDGVSVFPADEISKHIKPGELFCPVSYDSSQLAAVLYSEMGKSFVLHGPPGTGKSQTITNIIAHNLAKGRRVLFVSEKKAALDVVKDRLDRIGLTPFCLELHSNKTEKNRFYAQLKDALSVPETAEPGEWGKVVADFEACRGELNEYIAALHAAYPNGLTAYACFSQSILNGTSSHPELLDFDCLSQPRAAYEDARRAVQELLADFRGVSEEALRVVPPLKADDWSPALERQLAAAVSELSSAARDLVAALEPVCRQMGLDDWSATGVREVSLLLKSLHGRAKLCKRFFAPSGNTPALLAELNRLDAIRTEALPSLGAYRLERLCELDLDGIENRLELNARSFCLLRFFRNRALVKELADVVRPGGAKLTMEMLVSDMPAIRAFVTSSRAFGQQADCSPDDVMDVPAGFSDQTSAVQKAWAAFDAARSAVCELADVASWDADVRKVEECCQAFGENLGELRNVLRYRATCVRAKELGVGAFVDYLVREDDGSLDAVRVFDDSYATKMLDAILVKTPVLAAFTGVGQDERIARFRALDGKYMALSKKMVFARLAASLPSRRNGPCPQGTELGMLKRECEKKTRQKAVRQILSESRTLIPALKPCFLMSPLSVAQYLPVDSEPFDLVVFDEASQIPVWDAIGVIARGKQLVVVGDPKQMPPTNFFQKGDEESEDEEDMVIEDQESILDECLVAGVYSTYLNWHYRSRHESLIAFSNEHYYSNKLCTFPSASNSPRLGVKFVFVPDGRFSRTDKGKGPRVNEVEARALVDYVCETVRKPDYKKRSLGIVTFSMPQQKLILQLLEERRAADHVLEQILPEEGEGAYFVKNLENVQGDESDVILFSVGYAPDENGRFTMNFGPLNLAGGERRLNVAVTRAKEQVVVFSSIRGSQIDAGEGGRTKAVGAGHLKAFLEYAERGSAQPASALDSSENEGVSDAVAAFLAEKGYVVDRNVGCSDYRIDLAVRDPDDADRYLLGIECDGPAYARQRTAQDRDINRAGVLRGLGWRMCRVWSIDWAYDRKRAEDRLLAQVESARRGEAEVAPEPVPVPEPAKEIATSAADASAETTCRAADEQQVYRPWQSVRAYSSDSFYDESSLRVMEVINEVIKAEGPICESLLRKRVAKAWGLTRMTDRVNRVFDRNVPMYVPVTAHEGGKVYWAANQDPKTYRAYRVPSKDAASKRTVDEIPPEELANAMRDLSGAFGACTQDALYRETARCFGLSALTAKTRRLFDAAYAELQRGSDAL